MRIRLQWESSEMIMSAVQSSENVHSGGMSHITMETLHRSSGHGFDPCSRLGGNDTTVFTPDNCDRYPLM